jgi:integrase/recombinase XerD
MRIVGYMTTMSSRQPAPPFLSADLLRLALSAYLARFKGLSRQHTDSDLRLFMIWCAERGLEPLTAQRTDLEMYLRWM